MRRCRWERAVGTKKKNQDHGCPESMVNEVRGKASNPLDREQQTRTTANHRCGADRDTTLNNRFEILEREE